MKECTACHSTYPPAFSHCPRDGALLIDCDAWSAGGVIRGKYRILNQCGAGAMAVVYKAEHIPFREVRALKVINAALADDETFVRRFKQEALLARRLQHPNVVRIDDIEDAEDGRPFIIMEFIDGVDLRTTMQRGPLELGRVLAITRQVASALDAAHSVGMIHRDIKPANILLIQTPNGEQAKVADFGIAKITEGNRSDGTSSLTQLGEVIGSPAYMSPEQAMGKRGDEIDGRSDIYSLGVVMYQALSGKLPVVADSETEFLIAQVSKPPIPIRTVCPGLPNLVADVIMACLEKDRERRPASAKALIAALANREPAAQATTQKAAVAAASRAGPIPEILLALAWGLILWMATVLASPFAWLVAAAGMGIMDTGYLAAKHLRQAPQTKTLIAGWIAAGLCSAVFFYFANTQANTIWSYLEPSVDVQMATIRWWIMAWSALLCIGIGGWATLKSIQNFTGTAKAILVLCGIFLAVCVGASAFSRSGISIAIAGVAPVWTRCLFCPARGQRQLGRDATN